VASEPDAPRGRAVDPKEVVRRVVEDVVTGGRLELIDEVYLHGA